MGLVRLSEAGYEALSFLDERILGETGPVSWTASSALDASAAALAGECDFIFHIGHVGSTLLSRILGTSERVFSLREPAILRTLAQLEFDLGDPGGPWNRAELEERLAVFLRLWARVYRAGQKTLLKATSFVSEIAPLLMRRSPSARAILMFVSPMTYMETILGGPNSRLELGALASRRLARLARRLGGPVWRGETLSEGELAAMSWICEILCLTEVAAGFEGRVLWMDFDVFLARPTERLAGALSHLHGQASETVASAMARGPHLGRYSKAPEHAYDADLRRTVLAGARAEHGDEIERGVAWLNAAADAHPMIAAAIRVVAAARGG